MSLALIQESAKEVRRLSIAGSNLAVGDFRLKKLISPLEQAGAKVPVFAQVAKAISDLVNGKEADSAANLLSLSTLLNAILYTQGQTAAEGDCRDLEILATKSASTRTSARVLKPLVEALTSTGSGRFQLIKSAVERGAFNDLRLVEPAMRALDDVYPEIADLVMEKVLPPYGSGIAPLLKQKLDVKGKKGDARRLCALHDADPGGSIEVCKTALEEGSPEVRAAAVGCLAKHEECLPLVMEQADSKNKVVRAAALEALAAHDRPEITKLFTNLLGGKALELLARPFRAMRSRQVLNSLFAEGNRAFDLVLKSDEEQIARFAEVLACLEGRKDAETEDFLLSCLGQCDKLARLKTPKKSPISGADLADRLASLTYCLGSPKALEALLGKHAVLPTASFGKVLRSALRLWPADKVYTEFAPLLEQKKGPNKDKAGEIRLAIWTTRHADDADFYAGEDENPDTSDAQSLKKVVWDGRWLDAAIKADEMDMVCSLARPGHKGVIAYLTKGMDEPKNRLRVSSIMEALSRCQYSPLTDLFLDTVKKRTKTRGSLHHELHELLQSARYLPVSDLPRLDAFASSLDETYVDRYLEALAPLRAANQPEQNP